MRTMTVKEIEKMELKKVMSNAVPNTVHTYQKREISLNPTQLLLTS